MAGHVYTIKDKDVGRPLIRINGRTYLVQNFIGQIFPFDVGKRVYETDGVL